MGRLKGIDEMPDRTGLELDWSTILPDEGASVGSTSMRTKIISLTLAVVIVAAGVYVIGLGMLPTGAQIRGEMQRRWAVMAEARRQGEALEPATKPGIAGVADASATDEGSRLFYKDRLGVPFPAGTLDIEIHADNEPVLTPISIADETGNGLAKVVKVRDLVGGRLWVTIYIAPQGRSMISLPPGGYIVSIAEGLNWFGGDKQFGEEGRYYAAQNLDVRAGLGLSIGLPAIGDGPGLRQVDREDF